MSTFQAVVYSVLYGITEFFPLSVEAHFSIFSFLSKWPLPEKDLMGSIHLGGFLALLTFLRHDVASMISGFLQVLVYRKYPRTLDERIPFFILISFLPVLLTVGYLKNYWVSFPDTTVSIHSVKFLAISMSLAALPVWVFDRFFSRPSKSMVDWNIYDAFFVGICQTLMILPGIGNLIPAFTASVMRNYTKEASIRYSLYGLLLILAYHAQSAIRTINFTNSTPIQGVSWFTCTVSLFVSFFTSLLIINILIRNIQKLSTGKFVTYRWITAFLALGYLWYN